MTLSRTSIGMGVGMLCYNSGMTEKAIRLLVAGAPDDVAWFTVERAEFYSRQADKVGEFDVMRVPELVVTLYGAQHRRVREQGTAADTVVAKAIERWDDGGDDFAREFDGGD